MGEVIRDTYQILASSAEGEYKEKGSKFLAYAFPVTTIGEIEYHLLELRDLHHKARHHCYAYRIGIDGELYRANDDGEPSGTAGKPIYGQLLSHDISDALVVVIRYFGGTKLGASGLINAYKTAASEALTVASKKDKTLCDIYRLTFDYAEMGHVLNVTKHLHLDIIKKTFESEPFIEIEVPRSKIDESLCLLKAKLLNVSPEQITEKTVISFCKIEKKNK